LKQRPILAEGKHYFDPHRAPDQGKGKEEEQGSFLVDHLVVINVPRALAAAIAAHEASLAEKQAGEFVFDSGNETEGSKLVAAANKATSRATALALDVVELFRPLTSGLAHAVTSVQFSPAETHALVGFGVREKGLVADHRLYQPSLEVLRLDDRPPAPPAPAFVPWLVDRGEGVGEGFVAQCVELHAPPSPPSPTTVAAALDLSLRASMKAKTAEHHRHEQSEQQEQRQGKAKGQGRELVKVLARPPTGIFPVGGVEWPWASINAGLYGPQQREARVAWANLLREFAFAAAVRRSVDALAAALAECAAAEVDLSS
jgi:hypothetical protein